MIYQRDLWVQRVVFSCFSFKDESEQQLRVIEDLDSKCVVLEKQCKELVKKVGTRWYFLHKQLGI